MIKPEQIPPEAYAAAAELLAEGCRTDQAIAAALNAWPNAWKPDKFDLYELRNTIILPLTQEASDAEA